jgi:transcription termination factor Rho
VATSQNIEDMKLPELKTLAKQMGLRGTSMMRKPELIATLQAARNGGQAPSGVTVGTPQSASASSQVSATANGAEKKAKQSSAKESNDGRGSVSGSMNNASGNSAKQEKNTDHSIQLPSDELDVEQILSNQVHAEDAPLFEDEEPVRRGAKSSAGADRNGRGAGDNETHTRRRMRHSEQKSDADTTSSEVRDLDDILALLPVPGEEEVASDEMKDAREEEPHHDFARRSRRNNDRYNHEDSNDRHQRRVRGRDRNYDRKDRDNRNERNGRYDNDNVRANAGEARERRGESREGMVPVAGIVDVLDSYAFIRTSGYLPGPNDVYVSMGQIRKYGLRKGDAVQGCIREPREGDRRNQRQKFVPLQSIDTVNGMSVEEAANRPQFSKLTPLYPQERLKQETTPNKIIGRLIDLVAPIGKGQRGLIVSPPKAGKTITLQNIANAIAANNPEVHLMMVLVDERPEEVTDMERTVQGEVISSTFDRPASDHTTVAELAIERAKRLVELGQDVVVLLDSMTRLARAYNIAAPASGRVLSGGVDAQALYPPKKFFGAARNIENGGSLTIISSALVETGSKMDEVIFEEFKGTGNMELRLSRDLANKRLFPAIDINASGTRREELITQNDELAVIYRLRRLLGGLEAEQAYQTIVPRLKKTATNRDFLQAIIKQNGNS